MNRLGRITKLGLGLPYVARRLLGVAVICFIFHSHAFALESGSGQVQRCRAGEILEVKKLLPDEIKGGSSVAGNKEKLLLVVVKADCGRSLSVYDYAIELAESEYPCIAISSNPNDFSVHTTELFGDGTMRFGMLFEDCGRESEDMNLKFRIVNTGLVRTKLAISSKKSPSEKPAGESVLKDLPAQDEKAKLELGAAPSFSEKEKVAKEQSATSAGKSRTGIKELTDEERKRLDAELIASLEKSKGSQAPVQPVQSSSTAASTAQASVSPVAGAIDLNKASRDELLSLPGIGEGTVDRIIAGRPYSAVQDLLKVKGVRKLNYEMFAQLLKID